MSTYHIDYILMNKEKFIQLIYKMLSGLATKPEREFLEKYDRLFEADQVPFLSDDKADKIKKEIYERIHLHGDEANKVRRFYRHYTVSAVAASVSLCLLISWLLYTLPGKAPVGESAAEYREVKVPAGKISRVVLSDGTKVMLNAGSRLYYQEPFGGGLREVKLEGEGYFEVARRPDRPFVIHTEDLRVRVLGTSFNVRAYKGNSQPEVSVVHGKVSVEPARNKDRQPVLVTPGQKATYSVSEGNFATDSCSGDYVMAWQRGVLIFQNTPFKEVAGALERKFDIRINLDKSLENCTFYAQIENEPVGVTLTALTRLIGADLKKKENVFYITGTGCNSR